MVCGTIVLAGTVALRTSSNALLAPLCAGVVGNCLGVLGGVGGEVVLADAGVVEGRGIAVILERKSVRDSS
jgi:hypothetical protein